MKDGIRRRDFRVQNLDISGQFTGTGAGTLDQSEESDIWYVNEDVLTAASGDGKTWEGAFLTVAEAVAAAGDFDIIRIAGCDDNAGIYDEAATLSITQDFLKIIGPSQTRGFNTYLSDGDSSDSIINILAHNVEICYLGFYVATDAKSAITLGTAGSATSYFGTWIHDCYCYMGSGEYFFTEQTNPDAPDLLIQNCKIQGASTAGIKLMATRGEVRNCYIKVAAALVGIAFTVRGDLELIKDNVIVGAASTDTGITISGNNDGNFVIANNTIVNCNAAMTQDVGDANVASNNYVYSGSGVEAVADPTS